MLKSNSGRKDDAEKQKEKKAQTKAKLEPTVSVPIDEPTQMMLTHFSGRSSLDDLYPIPEPEQWSNATHTVAIRQKEPDVTDSEPSN
jgi:hypothetical protein